ncbi:MAG: 30S ribosomal protein S1 [Gimesia sp.]|jgi:small subunit ribosomal protein S1|uniref:30S ribosomal protein S1 n=1 Tax=Gimesia maris TaxID=122 RepID=A0A3D3RFW3_9PLAN|nr:30S ribosomal protein S1 [Gimesia sp.]HCO27709.1 30S ribosomal protein S1 [Gimesia maris]|tara:strand:- start:78822 stop:80537 length:1716 start_codon:yes stop_codon:yes gene_type:complete
MSSERPSTEEVNTSEEALEAKSPADQEQPETPQESDAGVNEATSSAPAETPQPETPAEPEAAASQEADKAERKVQLKPKVDPAQFKAIPAKGSSVAPANKEGGDAEASAEPTQEQLQEAAMMQIAEAAEPVDIPPAVDDLDGDLEAELAAALSGQGAQELPKTLSDEEIAAEANSEDATAPATPAAKSGAAEEGVGEGDRLKGVVESINNDDVFIDLGAKAMGVPGIVPLRQFGEKTPVIGQEVDVKVTSVKEAEGLIQLSLPRGHHKPAGDWDAVSAGQVVECVVNKSNKGGLEVNVGSLRGFLPASQVDLYFVGDLEPFVGQKLTVQITEVNPKKRNLVVSRRKYLESEREEIQKELWEKLAIGQEHTGTVKNIKDYGAFVDLGGIDGFLHIGEISWNRIKHPKDALSEHQQINVKILKIDKEKNRISLGMKQLQQDPWQLAEDRYATGSTISGKVTRTTDFGAFIELEPGLEGLIHISELDHRRVKRVTEVLTTGQETSAKVLEVDPNRKRISLSIKALIDKPEAAEAPVEDQPSYERKRKGPLLGGNADESAGGGSGGLFGNPKDYK